MDAGGWPRPAQPEGSSSGKVSDFSCEFGMIFGAPSNSHEVFSVLYRTLSLIESGSISSNHVGGLGAECGNLRLTC